MSIKSQNSKLKTQIFLVITSFVLPSLRNHEVAAAILFKIGSRVASLLGMTIAKFVIICYLLLVICYLPPRLVSAETVNSNSVVTKVGEPKADKPEINQLKDNEEGGLSYTGENVWPTKRGMIMYDSFVQTHTNIDAVDVVGVDSTDSVFSTHDGEVLFAGWDKVNNGTYGNMVMVKSNDNKFISLYAHMSQILAKQGVEIKKGGLIGKVGATSSVPGFANLHLHYEHRLTGPLFGIIGKGPGMGPPILPKLVPFRCSSPVFCNTKW